MHSISSAYINKDIDFSNPRKDTDERWDVAGARKKGGNKWVLKDIDWKPVELKILKKNKDGILQRRYEL